MTTLEKPTPDAQLQAPLLLREELEHGIIREWLYGKRLLVLTLHQTHADAVQVWTTVFTEAVQHWDRSKPLLVLHDLTQVGMTLTPALRKMVDRLMQEINMQGRVAMALPTNAISKLMRMIMNRRPVQNNRDFFYYVFHDRQSALEWLEAPIPEDILAAGHAEIAALPQITSPEPAVADTLLPKAAPRPVVIISGSEEEWINAEEQSVLQTTPVAPPGLALQVDAFVSTDNPTRPSSPASEFKIKPPARSRNAKRSTLEMLAAKLASHEAFDPTAPPLTMTMIMEQLKPLFESESLKDAGFGVQYTWLKDRKVAVFTIQEPNRSSVDAFVKAALGAVSTCHEKTFALLLTGKALVDGSSTAFVPYLRIRLRQLHNTHPDLTMRSALLFSTEVLKKSGNDFFAMSHIPSHHASTVFADVKRALEWLQNSN